MIQLAWIFEYFQLFKILPRRGVLRGSGVEFLLDFVKLFII